MPINKAKTIWMNGKFVNWDDAKIHILSHVIHYGSCWFEGIRCYKTKNGSAIFRLREHVNRLFDSSKIYRAGIPYSIQEIENGIIETVKANDYKECYIRPIVYRGYGEVGVNPLNCPVDVSIIAYEWGKYLGKEALDNGIDVMVSTWQRNSANTTPTLSKAAGNYLNSQLIKMEAVLSGYAEGIALDKNGFVSEGSGENLFIIKDGILYTSSASSGILLGITRDTVIKFAREINLEVKELNIPREFLIIADEVFFTGTAAEITPIRSIDKIQVGNGKVGPITKQLQEKFFDIVLNGNNKNNWLKFI